MSLDADLDRIAELLRAARRVLFVTGAGLSADSGLPTYRGVSGLYEDAGTEESLPIEAALSGEVFTRAPHITWRHIARIEAACRGARVNRGHEVIAALDGDGREVWVLTQNVDGLHRRAGSTRVVDIHGEVSRLLCPRCGWSERVTDYAHLTTMPPPCPACGAVIRPDVVLFGEMLDPAKVDTLQRELMRGFDLVFSVGTSSLFPYIQAPVEEAAREGIPSVEINPGDTEVSRLATYRLRAGAADTLDALYRRATDPLWKPGPESR